MKDESHFFVHLQDERLRLGPKSRNLSILIAQTQLNGLLQVEASDEDALGRYGKLSTPPSLISSSYHHYLHILPIPSEDLTSP